MALKSGIGHITLEQVDQFSQSYQENKLLRVVTNALDKNGIEAVTHVGSAARATQNMFSVNLPTLEVTNQKRSGRCWIFAGLNVLRERVAKKYKLEKFELSQNYVAFWDKFEKINFFLESVLDRIDQPVDDRTLTWILQTGVQDGGQWDMLVSLVEKYGVIPKSAMDETYQSSNTGLMNDLIRMKLTQYASILRGKHEAGESQEGLEAEKGDMLKEMYGFLCTCFGEPPKVFDFEYTYKDKEKPEGEQETYQVIRGLTPLGFYKNIVGGGLEEYVSLINAPTGDKPYHRTYTVDYLGNVVGGRPVKYLNIEMDTLVNAIVAQLKAGEPVWFGSDVGKFGDREAGIWDDNAYDYGSAFEMDMAVTKSEGLDYRWSAMNHAMVITGVNLDENGIPNRWKIENSWSDENGFKGYYIMSGSWFNRFVYQAVVHKKHLADGLLKEMEQEPIHLNPWDPMGSLAD